MTFLYYIACSHCSSVNENANSSRIVVLLYWFCRNCGDKCLLKLSYLLSLPRRKKDTNKGASVYNPFLSHVLIRCFRQLSIKCKSKASISTHLLTFIISKSLGCKQQEETRREKSCNTYELLFNRKISSPKTIQCFYSTKHHIILQEISQY